MAEINKAVIPSAKTGIDEKKNEKRKNEKTTFMLKGIDIDSVCKEIRRITPCNRKTIQHMALYRTIKGRSIRDIAKDVQNWNVENKANEELSDRIV